MPYTSELYFPMNQTKKIIYDEAQILDLRYVSSKHDVMCSLLFSLATNFGFGFVDYRKRLLRIENKQLDSFKEYMQANNGFKDLLKLRLCQKYINKDVSFDSNQVDDLLHLIEIMLLENENLFDVAFKNNKLEDSPRGQAILQTLKTRSNKKIKYLLERGESAPYAKVKIMILGCGGVGKTCTLNALLGKEFSKLHHSTVVGDINIDVKVLNIHEWKEDKRVKCGQLTNFNSDLLDMHDRISIDALNRENAKIFQVPKDDEKCIRITEKAKEIEIEQNICIKEEIGGMPDTKSADKNIEMTLNIWDFGGQKVFDALHHVFLTNDGLFLLVFSLPNLISNEEIEIENLRHWLSSMQIYSRKSKIFMIGTRAADPVAQVVENIVRANTRIRKLCGEFHELMFIKNRPHFSDGKEPLHFFRIENSLKDLNKRFMSILKKAIAHEVLSPSTHSGVQHVWKQNIPLAWTFLMDKIVSKESNLTTLKKVFDLGKINGFSDKEIRQLFVFFSNSGAILSCFNKFCDTKNHKITNTVVLNPQWFLKSFARFIFDFNLHENFISSFEFENDLCFLCDLYKDTGILTLKLLKNLLARHGCQDYEIQFMVNFAAEKFVICLLPRLPENIDVLGKTERENTFYIVPSMIPDYKKPEEFQKSSQGYIKWDSILPKGFFHRFCCCLSHVSLELNNYRPLDFTKNTMSISFNGYKILINRASNRNYHVWSESYHTDNLEEFGRLIFVLTKNLLNKNLGVTDKLVGSFHINRSRKSFHITMNGIIRNPVKTLEEKVQVKKYAFDCFLSHSWGENCVTHNRVLTIAKHLTRQGLKVWVDETCLKRELVSEITSAMESSAIVLVFITKEYIKKVNQGGNNCSKEYNLAAKMSPNRTIGVLLDKNVRDANQWRGTFAFHFENKLYHDFSTEANVARNMKRLVTIITQQNQ